MKMIALAAGILFAASAEAAVKTGDLAPDFTLTDSRGKPRKLSDFKGKIVVLEWHNRDCPYVKKHYESGNIPRLQKAYAQKGVIWLSIISSAEGKQGHVSGKQANANMKKAGAMPSYVLLDPAGTVGRLYDAKTTPHMYVIDGKGKLRYQGAIDSNPSADKGDIAGAENYAAAALDALLLGKAVKTGTTKPYGCSVKY